MNIAMMFLIAMALNKTVLARVYYYISFVVSFFTCFVCFAFFVFEMGILYLKRRYLM